MGELLDDPGALQARVAAVRTYLAGAGGVTPESIELRVAASVTHLGLSARTLSPVFALAVLGPPGATAPGLSLRDLRWQPTVGSMFALSMPESASGSEQFVVDPLARELCAIMRPFGVSERVLRGNIASALNGARVALSSAEPELAPAARAVLGRVLAEPLLAGTARIAADGRFRRRSCCLIYRAAPDRRGPLCGDCVLAGGPG